MAFLRNLLASILGSLVAFGVLFFMFLIFVSLAESGDQVSIRSGSVLELKFPYPVSEYGSFDPNDPFSIFANPAQGLNDITKAITVAKTDDRIEGISLDGPYLIAGISQTRAIREALADFKESGKFVYAYGDFFLQKDYYLSSVADSVFINPVGNFDFKGLAAEILYYKGFQEKTGLRMEVVRHGKYKSAVEPFLSDEMSPENREQIEELLHSLWESMRGEISASRGIAEAELDRIADGLLARSPERALENGLVDGILYRDEFDQILLRESGSTGKRPRTIALEDYILYSRKQRLGKAKDRIAVIYAEGEILYGKGSPNIIGQQTMRKAFRKAREDEHVKAIVLRINSPGGSALSSDIIWREIRRTQEVKPVVVSLSDVAASGGYYMAVAGQKIVAEPTTITGSIGVFLTIPNVGGLTDKIGINAQQVGTHDFALDYSVFEPLSDEFREVLREGIEESYQTFLKRVSEGRDISISQADSIAQGRVWSGEQALEIGLVDALGGMPEALELAAELAELSDYRLLELPKFKTGLERILEDMGMSASLGAEQVLEAELGREWAAILKKLKVQLRQEGLQARIPFTLEIR
jgi:protease-4